MACVASPLAPDSPSCLHDDVAKLYGEAQKLYADAQQDFNGDDAPAAWDLPEAMLTGGMPQGFENTRRDVGSLTMKIANKKADIEALLERMAKLQSRYKNMTEGKEEMSRTVKKAARKSQREKRRRKKKRDKAKKAKKKMAHPLDGIDEFSTTVKQEEPIPREEEPVPSKPGAHPLDDHFELGTEAEEAAAEKECDQQVERILEWIQACKDPGKDPFGDLQNKLKADFMEIEKVMHRMEGSSTQVFGEAPAKGPQTCMLEALEARERALEDARDELEVMDEETDEAAHFWGHLYACDSDDDEDEVDDEACSPEEAQLLLYLGHSLHDYLGDVEEHKHALMKASEQFEGGMF